ncbi:MAG: ABC transporter ATP-binding protein [Chloroflexi bacterium]|nr:MAG: spermidine/putrescine ABC transporter ATP-binding protein [Phototrophicales bacterium]RMF79328.1 MAG: ABC transporter ATP-binding protein [Chloroflexota bacterium]
MLNIQDVTHAFDEHTVLHAINLTVEAGEILCLLGPSGCGKTTLLRLIAGLEQVQYGEIIFDGQSIVEIPVHQRNFGLMFQDFALFPHLNVLDNVLFGLKSRRIPRADALKRAREMLSLVGMQHYAARDVSQLSGGERQRVALARSLAPSPRLLMLDEPLGSLDARLRENLLTELRQIIKSIGLTTIYVTHDQHEAYAVADRIAVMNVGHVEQVGEQEAIYKRPHTSFVARFLGLDNIVPVENMNGSCVYTALGQFEIQGQADALLLHPLGIHIVNPSQDEAIYGVVTERRFQGERYRLSLRHQSGIVLIFYVNADDTQSIPEVGDQISIGCKPEFIVPLKT